MFSEPQETAIKASFTEAWAENGLGEPPVADTERLDARTQPCHGSSSVEYGAAAPTICRPCPSVRQCLGAVMTAELSGGNWPHVFAGMTEEQRAKAVEDAREAQRKARPKQ